MRVGHLNVTRPVYYDRNPITIGGVGGGDSIGPHGITQRWSYICPSGSKAYVENTLAHVVREVAATTPGRAEVYTQVSLNSGGVADMVVARIVVNTQGQSDRMIAGGLGLLVAGDSIAGMTDDTSVNGTCDYVTTVKLTQFWA